jgi:hypothetical protein
VERRAYGYGTWSTHGEQDRRSIFFFRLFQEEFQRAQTTPTCEITILNLLAGARVVGVVHGAVLIIRANLLNATIFLLALRLWPLRCGMQPRHRVVPPNRSTVAAILPVLLGLFNLHAVNTV